MKVSRIWLAGIAYLLASTASAATVQYALDKSNSLPDGIDYLTVTISDEGDPGNIDFTVEVVQSSFPQPFSNFGMQTFFFNYDHDVLLDESNIVDLNPADWDIREDRNAGGGFGKFEFQFKGDGSSRTNVLTFSIAGVAGDTIDTYAMAADFLNNGSEEFFAAHVAGFSGDEFGVTSAKFAGSTLVPIPAAAWLFATGLGMLAWRRKRS